MQYTVVHEKLLQLYILYNVVWLSGMKLKFFRDSGKRYTISVCVSIN